MFLNISLSPNSRRKLSIAGKGLRQPLKTAFPLKWMEPGGLTGWMQFSGSWSDSGQAAGYYRSNLRKFRLTTHT